MSLITSILTGGINNHPTSSEEVNAVYTDFVSEGIVGSVGNTSGVAPATGGFAVNAQGTPAMAVNVTAGVAYVNATPSSQNNQTFRVKNTATEAVTISANSSGSTKYDWVYIKLDATNLNAPNTAGDNAATLVTSRSSSASSDDGTPPTYGYPIAVVTVANGASTIANGSIRDLRGQVSLNTGTNNSNTGWTSLSTTVTTATGYNKGNREYELTTGTDLTAVLSEGMRFKAVRGVTPPTQCADLELSSSQYASKTAPSGISFTDDFTCEAWINLESYSSTNQVIVSRYNGTSGWAFYLNASDGTVVLAGYSGGASNTSIVSSYQSVPLGRWVHVAANLDMSAFSTSSSKVYIDGLSVPAAVSRGGTNPTSLTQAGNLQIGNRDGGTAYFDGKVSDVRVWSVNRTATQIQDNMNQQLTGSETNLVGYWKLNGDFNDSTSNANNMTGSGGAVATSSDNPMNATEYGVITKVTASGFTVFTGNAYNIPNITLSTPSYSISATPFGFPSTDNKWYIVALYRVQVSTTSNATYGSYNGGGNAITIPTGSWNWSVDMSPFSSTTTVVEFAFATSSISGAAAGSQDPSLTYRVESAAAATTFDLQHREIPIDVTAPTTYTMYSVGATTSAGIDSDNQLHQYKLTCAYI